MISRKHCLSALAAVAMTLPAFAVDAASLDEPATRAVAYNDLDLDSRDGVRALYGRLRQAARVVCDVHEGKRIEERIAHRACMADALRTAVRDVDHPGLTAYAMRNDAVASQHAAR